MLDKIHIFISIFAALVVTIISIIEGSTLAVLSVRIVIIIIIFYFTGIFVRYFLKKNVFPDKPAEDIGTLIDEPAAEDTPTDVQADE